LVNVHNCPVNDPVSGSRKSPAISKCPLLLWKIAALRTWAALQVVSRALLAERHTITTV
jgi:hypothetical protein